MCEYYHSELGGCCFAQKDAPRVKCKGLKCKCECGLFNDEDIPENYGKYLIKKMKKNGAIFRKEEVIKDDELIFTLSDIADEFALDDTIMVFIVKANNGGRSNDGKDNGEKS